MTSLTPELRKTSQAARRMSRSWRQRVFDGCQMQEGMRAGGEVGRWGSTVSSHETVTGRKVQHREHDQWH